MLNDDWDLKQIVEVLCIEIIFNEGADMLSSAHRPSKQKSDASHRPMSTSYWQGTTNLMNVSMDRLIPVRADRTQIIDHLSLV